MIADTSQYVYAFGSYVYGEKVAELGMDLPTKLSTSNIAGRKGKRIGANFSDIVRLTVSGMLSEDSDENLALVNPLPLRQIVQRFKYGHRPELGKQRLVLNSAADGRPAEFVMAAVESVSGLKFDSPIIETEFEVVFVSEPEVWYDSLRSVNLRQSQIVAAPNTSYSAEVAYNGPDADFFADEEGLPLITLTVASLTTAQLETTDPPYVQISSDKDAQTFKLYPQANGTFIIDSYEEGIRSGASWASGTIFEYADYEQFLYLVGDNTAGGITNTISLLCRHCDVSSATLAYYPRHI